MFEGIVISVYLARLRPIFRGVFFRPEEYRLSSEHIDDAGVFDTGRIYKGLKHEDFGPAAEDPVAKLVIHFKGYRLPRMRTHGLNRNCQRSFL